jgi:hypothetical protein
MSEGTEQDRLGSARHGPALSDAPGAREWEQPGWPAPAEAWLDETLAGLRIQRLGPTEEVRARPWSTVRRVPSSAGELYFKACGPTSGHEPALMDLLARRWPERVPDLLAIEPERRWMLTADGGQPLRPLLREDRDLGHWRRLLPLYAEMQLALASSASDLLRLGVPDRRLAVLPGLYAALLEETDALQIGQPDGLTDSDLRRLHDLVPRVAAMCQELAALGLPETLHHGDLHDGNILVREGRYVVCDWGDSCIAHPFFSLRALLVSVESSLALPESDLLTLDGTPELAALRDAYLAHWGGGASPDDLLAAYRLSYPLGVINGALVWYPYRRQYPRYIPGLLQEFLAAMPSGR